MNAERLRRIAQDIREREDMFTMNNIGMPQCGAPGCIVGHTNARYGWSKLFNPYTTAKAHLALSASDASMLFEPQHVFWRGEWDYRDSIGSHISTEHAARTLEYAADRGVIDWDATADG